MWDTSCLLVPQHCFASSQNHNTHANGGKWKFAEEIKWNTNVANWNIISISEGKKKHKNVKSPLESAHIIDLFPRLGHFFFFFFISAASSSSKFPSHKPQLHLGNTTHSEAPAHGSPTLHLATTHHPSNPQHLVIPNNSYPIRKSIYNSITKGMREPGGRRTMLQWETCDPINQSLLLSWILSLSLQPQASIFPPSEQCTKGNYLMSRFSRIHTPDAIMENSRSFFLFNFNNSRRTAGRRDSLHCFQLHTLTVFVWFQDNSIFQDKQKHYYIKYTH